MIKILKRKNEDPLNTQEFYELMQTYRHSPMTNQEEVIKNFENIKIWIRKNYKKI